MEEAINQEKKEIYFNEYNVLMDNAVYLPIVSGQLQAYAQTRENIKKNYKFMPFIFYRDTVDNIVSKYNSPSVAAFSLSMWNTQLSLAVAKRIKEKFPNCLIIFGGSNIPTYSNDYLKEICFVDVVVRGEGEKTFADLLEAYLEGSSFENIAGITYRDDGKIIRNEQEQPTPINLDVFPSPYLEGTFDEIMKGDINFQAIIETNRGCPFSCAYCSWGQGGSNKRYRFFSVERNRQNANWIAEKGITYVFCADSNFGMFKEDIETIKSLVRAKEKHGFPKRFKVCYSKNSEENVFQIGRILHNTEMEQTITLSFQTMSATVAESIGRENIDATIFERLQKKYNALGIPTYTELILGLPNETYNSFLEGLDRCLAFDARNSGTENQIYVYHCQIYPNARLGDIEYQKKYGIKTVRCRLKELHAVPKPKGTPDEYEDIIISTNTLTNEEWKKVSIISWVMQLLHGFKLAVYPMRYLAKECGFKYSDFFDYFSTISNLQGFPLINKEINNFWFVLSSVLAGDSKCRIVPQFGKIYWNPEEVAFLNIVCKKEIFYKEFSSLLMNYLRSKEICFDEKRLQQLLLQQEREVPSCEDSLCNKVEFARELLWRRKSGNLLNKIASSSAERREK